MESQRRGKQWGLFARGVAGLALLGTLIGFSGRSFCQERIFVRGDANVDGKVSLADVFSILGYLHKGGEGRCLDAADADDSGGVDFADAITVLILVAGSDGDGFVPTAPFPRPGRDVSPDALGCEGGSLADEAEARRELRNGRQDPVVPEEEPVQPDPVAVVGVPCDDDFQLGAELEFIQFSPGRVDVFPGQSDVRVPLFLETVVGDVEGITISLFGDPRWVRLDSLRFCGPYVESYLSSASWTWTHEAARDQGFLAASLGLDIVTSTVTFPETPRQQVGELVFSVSPDVSPDSECTIEFLPTPRADGRPSVPTELIREGAAQRHGTCSLSVRVHPASEVFLRGDADRSGSIELSDALLIAGYLFTGIPAERIPCADAADADDDGRIDFPDAVLILRYLFLRGGAPFPPFPRWGVDTEFEDELHCEAAGMGR